MTDDETPTADDAPTDDTPTDVEPAAEAVTVEAPATPPEAAEEPPAAEPEKRERSYVRVPLWLLVIGAALVLAVGSFAIGRATAPEDDDWRDVRLGVPEQRLPDVVPPDELPGPSTNTAFLGVATQEVDDGAGIQQLAPGSPAEDAGLEIGDVITAVDEDDIDSPEALSAAIGEHDPGDDVTITYLRNGNDREVDVELADRAELRDPQPSPN